MRLIVTEKDSAARKIADILGGKVAVKEHGRGRQKVKSYHFTYEDDDAVAIGLRGHVMETVFPNTYRRWSLKYLGDMIATPDLAWVVDGGAAGTLAALRSVAKGATEVVIATDYDREGELIGHEALEILRGDALKRHPHDKPEKKKKAGAAGRGKAAAAPPAEPPADDGDPHVKAMLPAAVVDRHVRVRYSALTPRGGRGGLRQAVDRRLQPRRGGALASGHRPHLGRRAHALHVAGLVPLRLRLPLGRSRADAHAAPASSTASSSGAPSCRCRTGRSRPRWRTATTPSRWRTPRAASTRSRPWRPRWPAPRPTTARGHRLQGASRARSRRRRRSTRRRS